MSTRIAKTEIRNYLISTVWLPGLYEYETMVFDTEATNPWEELAVERCDRLSEAISTHVRLVKEWSNDNNE